MYVDMIIHKCMYVSNILYTIYYLCNMCLKNIFSSNLLLIYFCSDICLRSKNDFSWKWQLTIYVASIDRCVDAVWRSNLAWDWPCTASKCCSCWQLCNFHTNPTPCTFVHTFTFKYIDNLGHVITAGVATRETLRAAQNFCTHGNIRL